MKNAGFKQDALYLIRPDGHVALANDKQAVDELKTELEAFGLWLLGWSEAEIGKEARGMNP